MRILLLSDTHMFNDIFENITAHFKDKVDLMIHCGDSSLPVGDPLLEGYLVVKGNHDEADFPKEIVKDDIFITHGQYYHVYEGYDDLIKACKKNHCRYCFHGHTHVPTHQVIEGIHFINPGSTMMNRGSYGYGTFAIVDMNDNDLAVNFYHHTTFEKCNEVLPEGLETLAEFRDLAKKIREQKRS